MPGTKGRSGGRRPGSGRPGKASPRIPWRRVSAAARVGATEEEIIRGLPLPPRALEDPAHLTRFRDEVASGHALNRLDLRRLIRRRGLRGSPLAGSVNALSLLARNYLDWDSQIPVLETVPDLQTARERLGNLLGRLAAARSLIEGRTVTPLELLWRESELGSSPASGDPAPQER